MNSLIKRFKAFAKSEGFNPELYLEILIKIMSENKLFYFTGNDYHIANDLFEWRYITKIIKPIIDKNGCYHGNKIFFFSNNYEIELKETT